MWKHAWLYSEKVSGEVFDISILLEPTSPLRTSNDIEICLSTLIQDNIIVLLLLVLYLRTLDLKKH